MGKIIYKITEDREMPSVMPERAGKLDHLISWMEDNTRVYQLFIPSEEYTAERAIQKVRDEVGKRARVVGTEGEIEA